MPSNDAKIREYQKKIDSKRADLGPRPRLQTKTNLVLAVPNGSKINLNTVRTVEDFVDIVAGMAILRKGVEAANAYLGTNQEVRFGEYTFEEWLYDIKGRVGLIEYDAETKQLKTMEKKLSTLLSDEAKTVDELDDIGALLN